MARLFFSTERRPALGSTQPPIQWVPGALSPRVKRQGREADHSPPSSADVKNAWRYTSAPTHDVMLYQNAKGQLYFLPSKNNSV
jgi:hypothetical protein